LPRPPRRAIMPRESGDRCRPRSGWVGHQQGAAEGDPGARTRRTAGCGRASSRPHHGASGLGAVRGEKRWSGQGGRCPPGAACHAAGGAEAEAKGLQPRVGCLGWRAEANLSGIGHHRLAPRTAARSLAANQPGRHRKSGRREDSDGSSRTPARPATPPPSRTTQAPRPLLRPVGSPQAGDPALPHPAPRTPHPAPRPGAVVPTWREAPAASLKGVGWGGGRAPTAPACSR
jgi:hypothetical protein